ncbi:GIY-YIG nuclease family protein [Lachnospiraceae bacterium AM23-2LB]|nr:GIY-YIG nuclease family protein [Lachnospiraceae bacterium AM23-2LB]RJW01509.1 GIY-YIG nuclease family protein [Lachnospiraceae bacterium AM40-2BH]DAW20275.1 MAG TPA: GIY-YIG nuclease superfamily protein [Caudoviricetes sp.]
MKSNIQKVKAIESQNKRKILSVNQNVDESSGIYFLTRADENGIQYAYIGQAKHLLTRLAQHLSGYQHIDLSLKKHGMFSEGNVYGWKINFLHYPEDELDEHEQFWIKRYAKNGYQLRNKTAGGQGEGKKQISEYRPAKGYYDGITQGKKTLARELSHIMEKHLTVDLKPEKRGNKVSEKQLEKFNRLLDEKSYM